MLEMLIFLFASFSMMIFVFDAASPAESEESFDGDELQGYGQDANPDRTSFLSEEEFDNTQRGDTDLEANLVNESTDVTSLYENEDSNDSSPGSSESNVNSTLEESGVPDNASEGGEFVFEAGGGELIETGAGNDEIHAYNSSETETIVRAGDGNDEIHVSGDVDVETGKGNDLVFLSLNGLQETDLSALPTIVDYTPGQDGIMIDVYQDETIPEITVSKYDDENSLISLDGTPSCLVNGDPDQIKVELNPIEA